MSPGQIEGDRRRWAFTEDGPWQVEESELQWLSGIDVLRATTRRQVPLLTGRRRVPDLGRLATVSFRLGVALLGWVVFDRRRGGDASIAGLSRRLRMAAEHLGPTYIKLAQIISSGEGLFPAPLVEEFRRCRDQVRPESFASVRDVVEGDIGRPIEEVFSQFDPVALASASIAQVHCATLHSGEEVVVKVQRPTIRTQVHRDLKVMSWLAPFLVGRIPVAALANPPALVELFAETIGEELDFRLEAQNMLDVAEAFAALDQRGYVVARPHPRLVTRRVLVMERLHGFAFEDLESMRNAGIDTHDVIRIGVVGFTEGCLVHGIFHGDLHAGNLFVTPEGRIALMDFGITARLTPLERTAFLRLMLSGAIGDVRSQIEALRDLGTLPPDTDIDDVMSELGLDRDPIDPTALTQEELVAEIQRVVKALLAMGARLPKILMLYVKNLVFLDGAIALLAPDLDMVGEMARLSTHMATTHGERLARDAGMDLAGFEADRGAIRAGFGIVDGDTDSAVTYRELKARRELIRKRLG
ncbi:MAG: AarF/ABC1/UbiB kinase family protein [Microthrixaceae bacterium]|nr:AarF/ABC1/UbiB kinase family protein [Microthrixaceae bacterium]MCB1010734.1 AarF/ABC1/UbiB kinase family protein [Microthrixaceae bacterium]MCB9386337.1 AarF/ABC1/UbiB kinase family protein [Microthrixaceae bacterium]MCO5320940.1 AarF/UbiB family protein [Microthrixaceae bacterium]